MSTSLADARATAASGATFCTHCGLTVPRGLVREGENEQFCCSGCSTAYAIIRECGLEGYYRLPERREAPVESSGRRFEEFDHPAFHELYVKERGGLSETTLYLEGVHCASCVWLVERVPLAVPGVVRAELDVGRSLVHLAWNPAETPLSQIARFLDTLGYRAHPYRGMGVEAMRRAEDRAMLVRIGVAGAIAMNVMLFALALYSGFRGGMELGLERYFRWLSLLLVTPSLVWPGRLFFRGALSSIRTRVLHMDVPIALALAVGYVRGAWNTFTGRGPIYFDGLATLIFALLVGRFLQQRAHRAAADSAELLHSLSPSTARVVTPAGEVREVPAEALLPGMVLEVRPGDTVAADGDVVEGSSDLDLSLLTGETRLVAAGPGERVYAGTVNRTAALRVKVEETGESSRVGRILREVEDAARRRAPVVQLANSLAGGFVAVVVALAVVTGLAWMRISPDRALDNAIALLIVTCPCALALATPLAITVAIGRAARGGILVKGGDALELLARPSLLYLDKTGTVTEGRARLLEWDGQDELRPVVLALERHSPHPIAAGFQEAWTGVTPAEASHVTHVAGGGIEGTVDGSRVVVGAPAFVRTRAAAGPAHAAAAGSAALTPVLVAVDGRVVARAGFGDAVRPEARGAIDFLKSRGWRVRLLSGDDPAVVREAGEALGIAPEDCRGAATPEEKLAVIEAASKVGRVVMVGDGVNDAAAIARASVGVGVRGGAEACLAAADVFLARPGLGPLVDLVRGAERALFVIRRNIAFSLLYNLAGAGLAVAGILNPLIAAILMPVASLTVVLASWASRTFEEKKA